MMKAGIALFSVLAVGAVVVKIQEARWYRRAR